MSIFNIFNKKNKSSALFEQNILIKNGFICIIEKDVTT